MLLKDYLRDGACAAAQAVLALIKDHYIENSWNEEFKLYSAEINVGRWENCREQGYVVYLRNKDYTKQLNIAFFEHRNSDNICAIKWEQMSMNALTIDNADFGDKYKDKYDVSYSVSFNQHWEMAEWIKYELDAFWEN